MNEQGCISCAYNLWLPATPDSTPMSSVRLSVGFTVARNGSVRNVSVHRAPSASLEHIVAATVKDWIFVPDVRDGVHVEQHREVVMNFLYLPEN
jgi:outer membrane biosynthesis protein TonB